MATTSGRRPILSAFAALAILSLAAPGYPLMGQNDTVLEPIRYLRVAIHVFQNDSGTGNFHEATPEEKEFLLELVSWANHRLSHLDTLKPAVPSPFVGDARIRMRLDTIYFHRDTRAWDCSSEIDSPYMREHYIDGDSSLSYLQRYQTLPVFIGANNPVTGGHSYNIGDRGYIAVRGYYESFLRNDRSSALDECGRNLIHELGHCLGLTHNFTGGSEGDQCDNCPDNGCPLQGTSNNLMDYWPSFGYAISKCQFDLIHYYLSGGMGNISEIVINDSCYRVTGDACQVAAGAVLTITDTVYAHRDIVIKTGGLMQVAGYLSMPDETSITVEPGAQLLINGGTIGNLCGDLWQGVRVVDSADKGPAIVTIKSGGTIEHASIGLLAAAKVVTVLDSCEFRNCPESLVFLQGSEDTIRIENSNFHITNKLNHYEAGVFPGPFVYADRVPFIRISTCSFQNEPGTHIFDADWMGTGVRAMSQALQVEHSTFVNLTNGLDLYALSSTSTAEVCNNQFINNRVGVGAPHTGELLVTDNRFTMQRFNSGSTIGVLLADASRFSLCGNQFESLYGGGKMAGVVLQNPGNETAPVFHNRFSNVPVGVLLDGCPDVDSTLFEWALSKDAPNTLKLGPQFRYNQYEQVGLPVAMMPDSVHGTAIGSSMDVRKEPEIDALSWASGGYAWYNDQVQITAFNGWKNNTITQSDHGLYFFMNYMGTLAISDTLVHPRSYELLKHYLNQLKLVETSGSQLFDNGPYAALCRLSEVPAAARSAKITGSWTDNHTTDKSWLSQSLASISGNFVEADRMLTALGTDLASANLLAWADDQPGVSAEGHISEMPERAAYFELPDLAAFRFVQSNQSQSLFPAFQVYPNPAESYVLVEPQIGYSFDHSWHGNLRSDVGQVLRKIQINSWKTQIVDISDLSSGTYIIELYLGNQYLGAVKFIKLSH